MAGEVTTVSITQDTSNITVNSDVSVVSITSDVSVLLAAPATINTATINFSNATPAEITRVSSAGVSNLASRSDHVHSAANLLLDGGNY